MASKPQQESESDGGIYFVITSPTKVTSEAWNKWYDEEHVPDSKFLPFQSWNEDFKSSSLTFYQVLKASGPSTALRYDNITASTILSSPDKATSAKQEYLAIYPLKNLQWVGSDDFRTCRITSALLKGDDEGEGSIFAVAEIEARSYLWVDGYEGENSQEHPSQSISISFSETQPFMIIES